MALLTGTDTVYDAGGATGIGHQNREDLTNLITDISPDERPVVAAIGRGKASAVLHEWLVDTKRAAAANAQLEGDEFAYATCSPPTRVTNYCQIMRETVIASKTMEAVNKAGMSSWVAYQVAKKTVELGNDIEWAVLNNGAAVQGDAGTARSFRGMGDFISTNTTNAAGALTEAMINASAQACWTNGGKPTMLVVGAFNKRTVSGFTTGVVKNLNAMDKKFTTVVEVYESDFGVFRVVPDHFQPAAVVYMIDVSLWKLAYLRPLTVSEPSITGDSVKRAMVCELTLESLQQLGNAEVTNTSTS